MSNAFSQAQLDAILDAQDSRADCAGLTSAQVAELLRQAGHPAFTAPAAPTPQPPPRLDLPPPRGQVTPAPAPPAPQLPAAPAAPQLPAAPALGTDVPEGGAALSQEDIRVPTLKLQQKTSEGGEEVEPGHWFLSSDPTGATPERVVQILELSKGREFLLPYNDAEKEDALRGMLAQRHRMEVPEGVMAVCRSFDRVTPVPAEHGTLAAACGKCEYTRWTTIRGKRVPPKCRENYRVLVLDCATGLPAYTRVRGTALKPWQNLLTTLMVLVRRHPLFPGQAAPFSAFRVTLGSKPDREWLVPTLSIAPCTDEGEINLARALRQAIVSAPRVLEDADDFNGEEGPE